MDHHQPEQCDSYLDLMSLGVECGGYGELVLHLLKILNSFLLLKLIKIYMETTKAFTIAFASEA